MPDGSIVPFSIDGVSEEVRAIIPRVLKRETSALSLFHSPRAPSAKVVVLVNLREAHVGRGILDVHFWLDVLFSLAKSMNGKRLL